MIADATIERLRSKIESYDLSSKELTELLLILEFWYEVEVEKERRKNEKNRGG